MAVMLCINMCEDVSFSDVASSAIFLMTTIEATAVAASGPVLHVHVRRLETIMCFGFDISPMSRVDLVAICLSMQQCLTDAMLQQLHLIACNNVSYG